MHFGKKINKKSVHVLVRRGGESLNDFKSGASIGRISSDGASSTAVKRLNLTFLVCWDSLRVSLTPFLGEVIP